MSKKSVQFVILLFLIASCTPESETERFDKILSQEDVKVRIDQLNNFLDKYPATQLKERSLARLFADYCAIADTQRALEVAGQYIAQYPEEGRLRVYNSVAWTLAENAIATDSAVVYARRAVELAEQTEPRLKNMILDTYAFALYKNGQPEAARQTQMQAMKGNADDPDYMRRMADYQFDSGQKQEGIRTLLKTLLYSGQTEDYTKLERWFAELEGDILKREQKKKTMVSEVISEFLNQDNTAQRRSKAAVLLAFSGTEPETALEWANTALNDRTAQESVAERTTLIKNLALVLEASGENSKMLETLEQIRSYVPAFDYHYWYSLGSAYEKTGRKEQALQAYVSGMLWRKEPRLSAAANRILPEGQSLDQQIAAAKESELNFHPGTLDESAHKTSRIVVAELFTGAECNPCVGVDLAFDHLAGYFPRTTLAILEYHLHIPGPDPLTNKMSEQRYSYYGSDFGTPTVFINGVKKGYGGGPAIVQRVKFNEFRDEILSEFSTSEITVMNIESTRMEDVISLAISVSKSAGSTCTVKLHTALVEKSVDYRGANGIEKHAFVVRHLVNGAQGQTISLDEGTARVNAEINLKQVEENLKTYLDEFILNPPSRHRGFKDWRTRPESLQRDNLAIISWIQNDQTKQIIQSVYSDL